MKAKFFYWVNGSESCGTMLVVVPFCSASFIWFIWHCTLGRSTIGRTVAGTTWNLLRIFREHSHYSFSRLDNHGGAYWFVN